MKRNVALLLFACVLGGCDFAAITPNGPTGDMDLNTALDPRAASDDEPQVPGVDPIKYPERPPCKVCVTQRSKPNPYP